MLMPRLGSRDLALSLVYILLVGVLYFVPTGHEERAPKSVLRATGRVLSVDNVDIQQFGMVKTGAQDVRVEILDGPYKGEILDADNQLLGRMDIDKIFTTGDTALVAMDLDTGGDSPGIVSVVAQDHYRLGWETALLLLFAGMLVLYGGATGAKALLSFAFAAMMIWKIVIPGFLAGYDPVWLALGVVALLTGSIIFLVGGVNRRGLAAFAGAMLGVATTCLLAVYFTDKLAIRGAVMPFAETMLYSGYGHLDLARIFVAGVFFASSGAVMDLAMDVAASMDELAAHTPDLTFRRALKSGLSVGRAVVGTMTTTLLLAYSGGYVTLLMAFMAQGVPLANLFNMVYVAAEVTRTLVGSFGLVTVAPFTALAGAWIFTRTPAPDRSRS